jgi:hypothetical protein
MITNTPSVRGRAGGDGPHRRGTHSSALLRAAILAGLLVALLAALQAPALAAGDKDGEPQCGPFEHVQTYQEWGPADAFGHAVTVAYHATRCSTPTGDGVEVAIEGTAQIFRGGSTDGPELDTHGFAVFGSWQDPSNPEGWPPDWWECGVDALHYEWSIEDVYSFVVDAEDGAWTLDVTSGGDAVHWTHDAC